MEQEDQSRKPSPSDLTNEQWAIVEPLIPPAKQSRRGGHPRTVDMREVLNTIFHIPPDLVVKYQALDISDVIRSPTL